MNGPSTLRMPQLARAMQAMLGLDNQGGLVGNGNGERGAASGMARATAAAANGNGTESGDARNSSSSDPDRSRNPTWTPAEEADALEEVRMAVEQLVIPHQEPVELLPRADRVRRMQAEVIQGEYRLKHEECGDGAAARIKILPSYVDA